MSFYGRLMVPRVLRGLKGFFHLLFLLVFIFWIIFQVLLHLFLVFSDFSFLSLINHQISKQTTLYSRYFYDYLIFSLENVMVFLQAPFFRVFLIGSKPSSVLTNWPFYHFQHPLSFLLD